MKRVLNAFVKCVNPCWPARPAKMFRYLEYSLVEKGSFYTKIQFYGSQGPKNFRILTCPPPTLHSSCSLASLNLTRFLTLYSIDTHLTYQQQTTFENIVGKGDIARIEQFLLFPQCFQLNQIIVSPFVNIFDIIS